MSIKTCAILAGALAAALFAFAAEAKPLPVVERKIVEKTKTFEIDLSYPQTGVPAIDREIEQKVKGLAEEFRGDSVDEDIPHETPYSGELGYQVVRNDDQMFVVSFGFYTYTGGAHPNSNSFTFNFLRPDGWRIFLPEILGPKGIEKVSALSIAELHRQMAEQGAEFSMSDDDWVVRGAGPFADNFESFELHPNELLITFDAYQVAAYAAGPQEVRIPLAKLRDVMRADWRAPRPSYDCARAGTPIEMAICSDVALARLDRQVAERYAALVRDVYEAPKKEQLRNDQRAWIQARDGTCGPSSGAGLVQCLTAFYAKRYEVLLKTVL